MADGGKVIIKIDGDNKEFQKDVQSTKKMVDSIATSATKAFSKVAKTASVGFAAVGTAIGLIGKSAISAYADYEQLVGGVETLFKENAAAVIENANNAFRTAGMSANKYMDAITSFSASLLQSLDWDTERAMQKADMAVTDMADNANKMGSDINLIVQSYQSLARGNFAMLDNLKLGYGGTRAEMERLLADAENIKQANGEMVDYSIDRFADIVDAIHVVQTEMGITGTTALEASTTIQGSMNSMKSAWENLMTGLTDPKQNLSDLMEKFSESVETLVKNLVPRIKNVVSGVTELITVMVPDTLKKISDELKETIPFISKQLSYLADQIGGMLLKAIQKMKDSVPQMFHVLSGAIGSMMTKISESAPTLITSITGLLNEVLKGIGKTISDNLKNLPELSQSISTAIYENFPSIITTVSSVIGTLIDGTIEYGKGIVNRLPEVIETIINFIIENSAAFSEAFAKLFDALGEKLPDMIDGIIDQIPVIIDAITDALLGQDSKMAESGKKLFLAIIRNLPDIILAFVSIVPKIAIKLLEALAQQFSKGAKIVVDWLKEAFQPLIDWLSPVMETIKEFISELLAKIKEIWTSIMESLEPLKESIYNAFVQAWELIKTVWDLVQPYFIAVWEGIKVIFSVVKDVLGSFFQTAWDDIKNTWGSATEFFKNIWEEIKVVFSVVETFFGGMFSAAWEAVKSVWGTVTGFFQSVWDTIAGIFSVVQSVLSGDFSEAWEAIKGIVGSWAAYFSDVWESIKSVFSAVSSWFGSTFQAGWNAIKSAFSSVGQFFNNVWSTIKNAFHIGDMESIGKNIISGLWNGINSMVGWIVGNVQGVVSRIKNSFTGIKGFFIGSPSRWAYRVGAYVVEGFGNGVEENSNYAINAIETLTADLKTEVEKATEEIAKSAEDITKDMTDNEKRLFEALQKDIENNKKDIQDTFKEIASSAFDSIEEIEKAQKNFEDKLKGYGTLVANIKIKNEVGGEETTITTLGDLKAQTAALEKYEDTLLRVKERGNVPAEFFEVIRDMDMDEAMTFANLLLSASDAEFEEYIKDWTKQQETAARISKELFRDEAEELANNLTEQFEKTPEDFFEIGEESIKQFGEGFMENLQNVMDTVRAGIIASLSEIMPQGEMQIDAGMSGEGVISGGNVYNFYSSRDTTTEQLRAAQNQAVLNRLRGY